MLIKIVNNGRKKTYTCRHIATYRRLDGTGMDITATPIPGDHIPIIKLPEDGQSLYVMNDHTGRTVDSYHWPERTR